MPLLHPEADAILEHLKKEEIAFLYHFTSVNNLPVILREKGLYSKEKLLANNLLLSVESGGNTLSHNLDSRNNNWDKISLSLTPYLPMAYHKKREQHLCYFVLRPEIAALSGVVFTDTNAARNDHMRGEGLQGLNQIHFEIVRSITRVDKETWKKYIQAEVLIPTQIPFEYVHEIAFVSKASMMHAEVLCQTLSHPKFVVEEKLFADSQWASKDSISFPYVVEFVATDTNVDKSVLYLSHLSKNVFSKSRNSFVMLAALVKALTGTKATIFLSTIGSVMKERKVLQTLEFETSNLYSYKYPVPLSMLHIGIYLIEYYLNDLCRASLKFEVIK